MKMKNLRKVAALVLAVLVMLTNAPNAFADTVTQQDKLDKLVELEALMGEGNGVDGDKTMTRYRSIVMLLRLKGLEDEMLAYDYEGKDSFADAEGQWDYQKRLMAYIKNNPDVGVEGYPDGTFRPYQEITSQEYAKVMLEALGYEDDVDYTWHTVEDKAKEIGLISSLKEGTFKVLDVAEYTYDALSMTSKNDDITLGEQLGFVIVVTDLNVSSVKTLNLVQTQVSFNKAVDQSTAEDVDNYTLTDSDDDELDITDAELLDDEKTVVLTHENAGQQTEAVLEIEDVKDANEEEKLADFTSDDIEFLDMTLPEVEKAEVIGIDTIRLTFSEPMSKETLEEKGNYEVNDGDLYISSVTAANNNTQADIELYSDLEVGNVTVEITNDVTDEANFGVMPKTMTVSVVEDNDGPKIIGFKDAKKSEVTLIFDEPIIINDADADNYYHTNNSNTVDTDLDSDIHLSDDGIELTLNFTEHNLPGTAFVYILKDSIEDYWNNDNNQLMFEIEVEEDITAPVIEDVEVDSETKITLKFDEALDDDIAEDEDNYTLLDSDGDEVDEINDVSYNSDKHEITVTFEEELSGFYKIVLENIEDINENEMPKTTLEFEATDSTDPVKEDWTATIYNAGVKGQMVKVDFDEKMAVDGKYSVLDLEKYTIDGHSLADLDCDVDIDLVDNGTAVEIEIAPDEETDGVDIKAKNNGISIGRVADLAGNYTKAYISTFNLVSSDYVLIESVEATDLDTVVITFDDLLDDFEANDIVVTTDNSNESAAEANKLDLGKRSLSLNDDGNSVLTLTLASQDELDYTAQKDSAVYVYVIENNTVNKYGEPLKIKDNMLVDDEIAPTLYGGEDAELEDYVTITTNNVFKVIFSEGLKTDNITLSGSDFVIKADNDTLVNGIDFHIDSLEKTHVDDDTIVFELLGEFVGFEGDIEISITDSINYITDKSDNEIVDVDIDDFEVIMSN